MFSIDNGSDAPVARVALTLPGNGLFAEFFAPLGYELAERGVSHRALTLPGYDRTPALADPSWERLLRALDVEVTKSDASVLIGHSLGGLAALLLAARSDRIEGLVLLEPAIAPHWLARAVAAVYGRGWVRGVETEFDVRGPGYTRIADMDAFPQAVLDRVLEARSGTDLATERALITTAPTLYPLPFDQVRCPVLLVRGDSSGISQRLSQDRLKRRFPGAQTAVIERAGHWMANEQDVALAEVIASFVRGLG